MTTSFDSPIQQFSDNTSPSSSFSVCRHLLSFLNELDDLDNSNNAQEIEFKNQNHFYQPNLHSIHHHDDVDFFLNQIHQNYQMQFNTFNKPFKLHEKKLQYFETNTRQNNQGSIYIGNIPPDVQKEAVVEVAERFGSVVRVSLFAKEGYWKSAIVTFHNFEDANAAAAALHIKRIFLSFLFHKIICCRCSEVSASSNKSTNEFGLQNSFSSTRERNIKGMFSLLKDGPPGANLFIYDIPSIWKELDLLKIVGIYGHVVGIRVPQAVGSISHINRGFAFVSYDSKRSAMDAYKELNGLTVLGRSLKIQPKHGEEYHFGKGFYEGDSVEYMKHPRPPMKSNSMDGSLTAYASVPLTQKELRRCHSSTEDSMRRMPPRRPDFGFHPTR